MNRYINTTLRTLSALCAIFVGALGAANSTARASNPEGLAQLVIDDLGRSKGVALVPHCGDGGMVEAMHKHSGMVIHGYDRDLN
jgi:hypothetical protein